MQNSYKHIIIYDKTTGDITQCMSLPVDHEIRDDPNYGVLEGTCDPIRTKVDLTTQTLVPKDPPPTPYWQLRQQSYPGWQDFADAFYWQQNGDPSKMADYLARIKAVKAKYPKPQGN